jgi:hypothetical protein
MPEYLAPGVYVEEVSFRSRSIEGVSTTTTGFVGATRYGPTEGEPELITSFSQFERIYGGLDPLVYDGNSRHNYLAHGVRGFFDNGGARLYVARAFEPLSPPPEGVAESPAAERLRLGIASAPIPAPVAELRSAQAATDGAIAAIRAALNESSEALETARDAAIAALRQAVDAVLEGLDTTPPPALNYNYGVGEDDIGVQLSAFITNQLTGAESTAVNTLLSTWQTAINQGDARLQAANEAFADIEAAQTAVGAAYGSGVEDGEDAAIPPGTTAVNTTDLTNAEAGVTGASDAVSSTAAALEGLANTLESDLAAASNAPDVEALTAAEDEGAPADGPLQALISEALAVATTATTAPSPSVGEFNQSPVDEISSAAETITLQSRIADVIATADWLARFPGAAGNLTIFVTGRLGANVLSERDGDPVITQIRSGDLVLIVQGGTATIHSASRSNTGTWSFQPATGDPIAQDSLNPATAQVLPLTLTVEVQMPGKFAQPQLWDGLTISDLQNRVRDSATQVFAEEITNTLQRLETPVVLQAREGANIPPAELAANLTGLADWSELLASGARLQLNTFTLENGSDGNEPEPIYYRGFGDDNSQVKSGLRSLEDLEEISIVAAPGYSHRWDQRQADILAISQELLIHCETMRYRVAALDSPDNQSLSGVREYRALLDSTYAAIYYPWIRINDPVSEQVINLPPSGFITGIYARNDIQIGVHKAPANEVVRGAIGLETLINKGQQDVLNPLGINCIRFFEGRGIRVWGARTISSDPEWKYLNIRRYFVYLEASIDRATQWAVFEPNGERLWANVRRAVEGFLETEWREGRLAGAALEEAFFVRCDRSTMTQNDIDNGRMICLIGVSPLYTAEFVIFRIGQWTADRR